MSCSFFFADAEDVRRRFLAGLSAFVFSGALAFPGALSAGKAKRADSATSASLSRLEKQRKKGDVSGFRTELETLLQGPARNFFFITENLFDPKRRSKAFASTYHLVLLPGRNRFVDSFSDNIKRIVQEEIAMAQVLLPPLGKKDRNGLTPSASGLRSENHAAEALFRLYEEPDHKIYASETNTVWEANPEAYPDKEDNLWLKLPHTPLEKTAAGASLLKGDFDGFQKAVTELYEGPAWKVLALFHSRETKTGKTIFHLLAEARPSLSEIVKPTVFAFFKGKGLSNENAERHSLWLSDNIEARQRFLKNEDFKAAQMTNHNIYLYLSEINRLSDKERNDLLGLEESDADKKTADKIIKTRQAQAAELFGYLIETVVPSGLSGIRKDKKQTKAAQAQAMLFNGGAAALSWAGAAGAYEINLYLAGSGLVLAGGYASLRCYRAFKSWKNLKQEAPAALLSSPAASNN